MTTSGKIVICWSLLNTAFQLWSQWFFGRRMQRLETRFDLVEAKLEVFKSELGLLESRLEGVEAKVRDMDARLSVAAQERHWQNEIRRVSEKF